MKVVVGSLVCLYRSVAVPRRRDRQEAWAYFGSFGDDFFGDDPDDA